MEASKEMRALTRGRRMEVKWPTRGRAFASSRMVVEVSPLPNSSTFQTPSRSAVAPKAPSSSTLRKNGRACGGERALLSCHRRTRRPGTTTEGDRATGGGSHPGGLLEGGGELSVGGVHRDYERGVGVGDEEGQRIGRHDPQVAAEARAQPEHRVALGPLGAVGGRWFVWSTAGSRVVQGWGEGGAESGQGSSATKR